MGFKRKPPPGNVRRVTSTGQNMRVVLTNKAGRIVQCESFGERALLLRFDRDPSVRDYGSQPETFAYVDPQGKAHTYTPDFIVWRVNGEIEIHEVTRTERKEWPNQRQREEAAQRICQERNWRYIVHTQETLPCGSELANLLSLWKYRPLEYRHPQVATALAHRDLERPIPLKTLVHQIVQEQSLHPGQVLSAICHFLWHGELLTNWHTLLFVDAAPAPEALVWFASKREG